MKSAGRQPRPLPLRAIATAGLVLMCVAPGAADDSIPAIPLPEYRIDIAKPLDSGLAKYFLGGSGEISGTFKKDHQGGLVFPPIAIGAALHENLFEPTVLGRSAGESEPSLEFRLETSGRPLRLTRKGGNPADPGDTIVLETSGRPGEGWIVVGELSRLGRDDRGELSLTLRGADKLLATVGAGIFEGELIFEIRNDRLHDGQQIHLKQPVTLTIAGGRVLPSTVQVKPGSAERVGQSPEVSVVIEEVGLDSAEAELDPGWWLELDQDGSPLVKLPLPLRTAPSDVVFPISRNKPGDAGPQDWAWDPIQVPREPKFELGEDWADPGLDALILQRTQEAPPQEMGRVRVRRHTITTYLPPLLRVGTIQAYASWRPNDRARPAEGPRSRSSAKSAVASGLAVTPTLPLPGETISVVAAFRPRAGAKAAEPPEILAAELRRMKVPPQDGDPGEFLGFIDLNREGPPGALRYRGWTRLPASEPSATATGTYSVRIYHADDPDLNDVEKPEAGAPPDWFESLKDQRCVIRSVIEGESLATDSDDLTIQVFTDMVPPWWLVFDPRPKPPHEFRHPGGAGSEVCTNQANSFGLGLAAREDLRLSFTGLFFASDSDEALTAREVAYPNDKDSPKIHVLKWQGKSGATHDSSNDVISQNRAQASPDDPSQTVLLTAGKSEPKKGGAPKESESSGFDLPKGEDRLFLDFDIDITDLPANSSEIEDRRPRLRVARLALVGTDANDRLIGRAYSRRVVVWPRSFWKDEIGSLLVSGDFLAGLAVVLIVAALVIRAIRKWLRGRRGERARPASSAQTETNEAPRSRHPADSDYFGALDPEPEAPRPAPPPRPEPRPPEPRPDASYFDDQDPGGASSGGANYFD